MTLLEELLNYLDFVAMRQNPFTGLSRSITYEESSRIDQQVYDQIRKILEDCHDGAWVTIETMGRDDA